MGGLDEFFGLVDPDAVASSAFTLRNDLDFRPFDWCSSAIGYSCESSMNSSASLRAVRLPL